MSFTASGIAHATASGTTEAERTKSVLWAAVGGGGGGVPASGGAGDACRSRGPPPLVLRGVVAA